MSRDAESRDIFIQDNAGFVIDKINGFVITYVIEINIKEENNQWK